jgi:hypothetical protein
MTDILVQLRNLSAVHAAVIDNAKAKADNMIKAAAAAKLILPKAETGKVQQPPKK